MDDLTIRIVTLIPVFVGVFLKFIDIFIDRRRDISNRIDLLKKSASEMLADRLNAVLVHLQRVLGTNELIRDSFTETSDLVSRYVDELNRFVLVTRGLDNIQAVFTACQWILFGTMASGAVLFGFSLFVPAELYSKLTIASFSVVGLQFLIVGVLLFQGNKLSTYEKFW